MSEAMGLVGLVPAEHPLWKAWDAYKTTEDYANTLRWLQPKTSGEGELWAAFMAGFDAGQAVVKEQNTDG